MLSGSFVCAGRRRQWDATKNASAGKIGWTRKVRVLPFPHAQIAFSRHFRIWRRAIPARRSRRPRPWPWLVRSWGGGWERRPPAVGARPLWTSTEAKTSNLLPAHRRELALAPEGYQALGRGGGG